ncbi:hypothetical protein GCM10028895_19850 [Pontibacter rugosus]
MQSQYQRLTDSQWEIVKESLPIYRKCKDSLRVILDAIFWFLRVGAVTQPAGRLSQLTTNVLLFQEVEEGRHTGKA